jgi:lon-related putative ATP-dependent protease
MNVRPLEAAELRRRCDPEQFSFQTTRELEPLRERLGQERALEAFRFGIGIRREGYNLYAMGPPEAGKYTAVRSMLDARAAAEPTPQDLCYVHDFGSPNQPRALYLPAGTGRRLRDDVKKLIEELRTVIPGALEGDEFRARKQRFEEEEKARHNEALGALRDKAQKKKIALLHTPFGFALAPTKGGEVLEPAVFEKLGNEERARFKADIEALSAELAAVIEEAPRREQALRQKLKALIRETLTGAVGHLLADLREAYADQPEVVRHLVVLEQDVLDNFSDFLKPEEGAHPGPLAELEGMPSFHRYQVNLLVDNEATQGAPVIFEDHPLYDKLVGRVEHLSRLGALVTDFTLIKAGALHRANGGYLILDARNLVMQPFGWEGLKRALQSKLIRVEPINQLLGLVSTVSLEPEPVPLAIKVILLGDRHLFYLLDQLDPDFRTLFKVVVDFEDEVDRNGDTDLSYARLVATLARDESLRPFDRGGVARVIEECARWADDAEKLSAHMGTILDLLREADHWAGERSSDLIGAEDVSAAITRGERRGGRVKERSLEMIERGTLLIETAGEKVGQINGLSVLMLGRSSFGRPTRITVKTRLGKGEVVDIEREVSLGGPLHSKGVMILAGYLGARYAPEHPLSLSATVVFEQSYGMIEGDSASSAELYALLSSLSGAPIKQSLAVTGSVNQNGEVQAIGGVNEKIEGFFELCAARGLTGDQGVLIPASNVKHLMLRDEVVEAVRAGKFHVWPVRTIDEGLELLTGLPAGERDAVGKFPPGSVNARVEARLIALTRLRERAGEAVANARKAGGP